MPIEESYFQLHKFFVEADELAKKYLADYDLSMNQSCILLYIRKKHPQGTNMTELHHELDIAKATLSDQIKKLRNEGYLEIVHCKSDERKKDIKISSKMNEQIEELSKKIALMEEQLKGNLEQFIKVILEVEKND